MVGQWDGPGKKSGGPLFYWVQSPAAGKFFGSAHAFSLLVMMHIRGAKLTDRVNIVYVY